MESISNDRKVVIKYERSLIYEMHIIYGKQ